MCRHIHIYIHTPLPHTCICNWQLAEEAEDNSSSLPLQHLKTTWTECACLDARAQTFWVLPQASHLPFMFSVAIQTSQVRGMLHSHHIFIYIPHIRLHILPLRNEKPSLTLTIRHSHALYYQSTSKARQDQAGVPSPPSTKRVTAWWAFHPLGRTTSFSQKSKSQHKESPSFTTDC